MISRVDTHQSSGPRRSHPTNIKFISTPFGFVVSAKEMIRIVAIKVRREEIYSILSDRRGDRG